MNRMYQNIPNHGPLGIKKKLMDDVLYENTLEIRGSNSQLSRGGKYGQFLLPSEIGSFGVNIRGS